MDPQSSNLAITQRVGNLAKWGHVACIRTDARRGHFRLIKLEVDPRWEKGGLLEIYCSFGKLKGVNGLTRSLSFRSAILFLI